MKARPRNTTPLLAPPYPAGWSLDRGSRQLARRFQFHQVAEATSFLSRLQDSTDQHQVKAQVEICGNRFTVRLGRPRAGDAELEVARVLSESYPPPPRETCALGD